MPTYVYACNSCGVQFEQFQSFKDEPLRLCPRCEGDLRRVFQPVGIVFKGSGWYLTDSRKSSSALVGNTDSNAKSDDSSSNTDNSKPAESAPSSASAASDE